MLDTKEEERRGRCMDPLYSRQVTALMHCLRIVSKLCIAGIGLQCMGSIREVHVRRPVVHTTKSSIINQVQMGFATFSNSICIIRRVLFLLPFFVSLIIFWWIYLKNTFLQVWSWVNVHLHLSLVFLLYRAISNLHRKPPASDLSKVGG